MAEDELIYAHGKTYAFHKMWGKRTTETLDIVTDIDEDVSTMNLKNNWKKEGADPMLTL
ncbi:hypothetical protein [Kaarinaea lacus]